MSALERIRMILAEAETVDLADLSDEERDVVTRAWLRNSIDYVRELAAFARDRHSPIDPIARDELLDVLSDAHRVLGCAIERLRR